MSVRRAPSVVLVPAQCAIVYDGRSWSIQAAPPSWWLEDQEELLEVDERPHATLALVPSLPEQRTACRPGPGPCRRRHDHGSVRRAGGRLAS